jgi:hypothetical protein
MRRSCASFPTVSGNLPGIITDKMPARGQVHFGFDSGRFVTASFGRFGTPFKVYYQLVMRLGVNCGSCIWLILQCMIAVLVYMYVCLCCSYYL